MLSYENLSLVAETTLDIGIEGLLCVVVGILTGLALDKVSIFLLHAINMDKYDSSMKPSLLRMVIKTLFDVILFLPAISFVNYVIESIPTPILGRTGGDTVATVFTFYSLLLGFDSFGKTSKHLAATLKAQLGSYL